MDLATNDDDDNGCDYDDNDDDDDDLFSGIASNKRTTKVIVIPLITLVVPCNHPQPRRSRCFVPLPTDMAVSRDVLRH